MKRKSTPRTQTGCSTCRTRRIKCDEARPACKPCLRSGWTCPGYTTATPNSCMASSTTPRFYYLPVSIPGSAPTRYALHHFATTAAPAIGGYFSADFWTRRILQSCVHNVPVRRAVSALAGVHREFINCPVDMSFEPSREVVEAYGRAMKALRRYLRGGRAEVNVEVVMMCCAALFCFELVRGEQLAAGRHLRCGMDVLRQSLLGEDRRRSWEGRMQERREQSQLVDVFARMDLQASAFENGASFAMQRARLCEETRNDEHSDLRKQRPESDFDTHDYSMLLQRCFDFLVWRSTQRELDDTEISASLKPARDGLLAELKTRNEHLDALSVSNGQEPLSAQLKSAIARSRLHCSVLGILISQSLPTALPSPAPPPTLDDKAHDLLELAAEAISAPYQEVHATAGSRRREFCLHLGIVAPLFVLALKTSRAGVRAKCLSLLKRCKGRREGWYDADVVANVVEELRLRCGEAADFSLLERLGDDVAAHVQSGVETVIPVRYEAMVKARGLSRLLAVAG